MKNYVNVLEEDIVDIESEEETQENDDGKQFFVLPMTPPSDGKEEDIRIVGLYGEVGEDKCSGLIYSLLVKQAKKTMSQEGELITQPIRMFVSTHGGNALDMFAVYDAMKMIQAEDCEIHTVGMGKVMSAGVLLLAAGTKGERKIGKHCRLMIHSVFAGAVGNLTKMKIENKETEEIEKQYIRALAKESNLKVPEIREIIGDGHNHYLSAKKAVEYGFADKVV